MYTCIIVVEQWSDVTKVYLHIHIQIYSKFMSIYDCREAVVRLFIHIYNVHVYEYYICIIYICRFVDMYADIFTYICVYVCIYTYTLTYTYIHMS